MAAVVAALAMGVTACSGDGGEPRAAGGSPIFGDDRPVVGVRSGAPTLLRQDQTCDDVLSDFQSFAPDVLRSQFGGGDGFAVEQSVPTGEFDAADDAAAAAPDEATASRAGDAGDAGTSDTNTQEEGIDEPDMVETDGEHVFLVDQQDLVILDADTAAVQSTTTLDTYGGQLLLQGDRLLVISGAGGGYPMPVDDGPAIDLAPGAPAPGEPVPEGPIPVEPPSFHAGTVLQLIDVADRSAPRILETTEVEGSHVDTRVVDGVARIVVSSYPQPPQLFASRASSGDLDALDSSVAETRIDDWLPRFRTTSRPDTGAPSSIEGALVECADVLVPEVNAGLAETSVLRVDFDEGFDPADTTTVVAEAGAVYASASTLYLAATRWATPDEMGAVAGDDWSTAVHAFDLGGDGPAVHAASGEVAGSVLNQYSLSEHDGHLRIATTEGSPWSDVSESQSGVHVFERAGDELVEIGAVGGLGLTETIQSVRFMGPVGYVVTFRQTDPLYVIDLSDPREPRNVGELKIPGFSSYLHPIGEGRLVGVGRDADETGMDQGFQLSLFDVSDPTAPARLQTWTEREAWSSAGDDPHAFLWWAPESAVILPLERYAAPNANEPEGQGPGMTVLDVADDGITERATVRHEGRYPMRAVVVRDRLWSIFDGGVVVSEFTDLSAGEFVSYR